MVSDRTAFPLLGEPLAVDLANTIWASGGRPVDGLSTPERLAEWLRLQAGRLDGALDGLVPRLADVRALREALRSLFRAAMRGEPPPASAVAVVNDCSAASVPYPELVWTAGAAPSVQVRQRADDPAAAPLAVIARSGIALLAGEDRCRLRTCDGPGCVLLFVGANPQRRWCSPRLCGNRVRVARHYRRRA